MKFKKKIVTLLLMTALISANAVTMVSADEYIPGRDITINDDGGMFSDLFVVHNGKSYAPLRLVFPNLNDKDNKVGFSLMWESKNPNLVRMIYGNTDGGDPEPMTDALPFVGLRKSVDLRWDADGMGSLSVVEYYKEDNNLKTNDAYFSNLSDPVLIKKVDGGERVFISTDDIKKIVEILGINDNYCVKLY